MGVLCIRNEHISHEDGRECANDDDVNKGERQ
jgi:hypothetical protein